MANIIVNEFLSFVQNKIDVLDELSVIQICTSNFSEQEIEEGKNVLYSSCGNGLKNVQRKGDDKKKKNVKNVIKLLKEIEPQLQPSFVAKDLNRLPPVSFDYVDVTRLLKDITMLKSEITSLKLKFSAEIEELRVLKTQHPVHSCSQVNDSQSQYTPKRSSQKSPLTPVLVPHNSAKSVFTPTYRDIIASKTTQVQSKVSRTRRVDTTQDKLNTGKGFEREKY